MPTDSITVSRVISLKLRTTSRGNCVAVICFRPARICGLTSKIGGLFWAQEFVEFLGDRAVRGFDGGRRHADVEAALVVLDARLDAIFDSRIEREDKQSVLAIAIARTDRPAKR